MYFLLPLDQSGMLAGERARTAVRLLVCARLSGSFALPDRLRPRWNLALPEIVSKKAGISGKR